ncbi:putative serine/threonine-protein kinase receptor [Corylus avellana]|uniref:putative serine/threonine-protein kinase receptor n=1 Tax=Corylus avellana TaxID=13451 RepID=UPI00286A87EB|nr:putative serine/threonine-protein kinase receptor [Corylus avellana]
MTTNHQPWLLFVLLLILTYYTPCFSIAGDTLSPGHSLLESDTILSQGSKFELGFFKPGTSSKIYLGIWYKRFHEEIVWVANRENPLSHPSSSRLYLSENGNLLLFEGSSEIPVWSTNLTFPRSNITEAVLGDDGNFVLRDRSNTSTIFWESFDHPTDTWLPGAKLGIDKVTGKPQQVISWKNSEDPSPGVFSLGLDPNGSNQYFLKWNRSQIYWSSGLWNATSLNSLSEMSIILNYTFVSSKNERERYFTYSLRNPSTLARYRLDQTGQVRVLVWLTGVSLWSIFLSAPTNLSDVYALCGAFGVVQYPENFSNPCECLKGFKPFSIEDKRLNDWSGGCVRNSPLQCENNTYANDKKDWFMKISNMRLPVYSKAYLALNASRCELACMENCSCTAYAYNRSGCMIWEGALMNLLQLPYGGKIGQDIYLRLAADEYPDPSTKGESSSSNNLLLFDFDTELHAINDGMNIENNTKKQEKKDAELPLFSYKSVLAATNNFSAVNKLGEGGFGPVYKGKLLRGQEIAVKMLSKRSGQGIEEFRNETILIAKLQHRNLVRLLGCCIEQDEKILIYEYMPNKSLDFYLFDPTKKKMLCWEKRIHIIEGVAQGLLYLHQYSRLRIIHRDLKPSNILLDGEMKPKISDFGMARIVGGNETQANTKRIVGTYGYMSPEYAIKGLYSIKSDVFSFGVLLLEIVWELWRNGRSLELIEPTTGNPSSTSILSRFINIGLLCVQESPIDRPTMVDVVSFISNEYAPLPIPKPPAFCIDRNTTVANRGMGSMTTNHQPWLLFVLLLILSYYTPCFSIVGDTLSPGHSLLESDTILSQGSKFELGFFKPGTSSKIYLGIWYKRFHEEIVWVANRENPLSHPSSSRLYLSENGNLLLFEGSSEIPVWSTNLTFPRSNITEAVLGDDGNFVLRDRSNTSTIFWESFDHPTDTWLPGAKLGIDKVTGKPQQVISWKNSEDPSPGVFSLGLDPNGSNQYFLKWNRSQIYWSSGLWNVTSLNSLSEMSIILNYTFVSSKNGRGRYFTYSLRNPSTLARYRIDQTGQVRVLVWLTGISLWSIFLSAPTNLSDVYALCGAFGVVQYPENFSNPCECLKGFKPFSIEDNRLNDWSGGCVRNSPLQCENNTYANDKKDWFMKISNMRLPVYSKAYLALNASRCELACMENCSCTAYAYNRSGCMIWEGALMNLMQLPYGGKIGQDIYLRLAADEYPNPSTKGESSSSNNLLLFDFDTELHAINDGMNIENNTKKQEKKDAELPLFSYESVLAATNNFSAVNKLGEGGFGPVYKGKLLRGQEIAVKMLSKRSGQGIEEFRNETILIAKLQHRNLVRLLGCCIEQDEKILIYEYMPNKSLDFYLFDPTKKKMLGWEKRIHIIEGVAQGLLYLHQYSRLRIIHRDLKPSNILLDGEMKPKISDFGMARIVGGNETQANTKRIVGTYGYMSPEYAIKGLYSIKSDVFSFGVLLLEIVSGRKNTDFSNSDSLNLLSYVWELWRNGRSLELTDPTTGNPSSTSILSRFINIGLLCVQESPIDRPTMVDVVSFISNEYAPLPIPKPPAFCIDRNTTVANVENCSRNNITVSIMEAR